MQHVVRTATASAAYEIFARASEQLLLLAQCRKRASKSLSENGRFSNLDVMFGSSVWPRPWLFEPLGSQERRFRWLEWFESKYVRVSRISFRAENPKLSSVQNRWLLVELLPTPTIAGPTTTSAFDPAPLTRVRKSSTIFHAIKQSVILNFGDAGWGAVGVSLSGK
jgi:Rpp14/Pop5 family